MLEVGNDVLRILETHRQSHNVRSGAGLNLLRVGQLTMRCRGGVNDQRARIADVCQMREKLDVGHEFHAGVVATLQTEGEDRSRAFRRIFFCKLVILVAGQALDS